jgi:flagellar assembly protein FliH
MSSSNSGLAAGPRGRVLRGLTFDRAVSPLDAELPGPSVAVDPAVAAAEEQRGYDDGYRAGIAEGLAAGRAADPGAARARLEELFRSLAAAAEELRRRQALDLAGLEDALARAAVDLASAIIGRELEVSVSPGADALARALALVPAGSVAVARLHPADAAILADPPGGLTLIPDPAVEPGGCILEVGHSRIDAQLGSALDRVRALLLGDR